MRGLTFIFGLVLSVAEVRSSIHECIPPQTNQRIMFDYQLANGSWLSETIEGTNQKHSPKQEVRGLLVHPINNSYGCEPNAYGAQPKNTWIALVERGYCRFQLKEDVAISLGASGLIVYQNKDRDPIVMESLSHNISATMIRQRKGLKYSALVFNSTVYATMNSKELLIESATKDKSNIVLLALMGLMSPTAILLNLIALVAILWYPEKPKPYLYLIANLVVTDLFVAIIGTSLILMLHNSVDFSDADANGGDSDGRVEHLCTAYILTDIWDSCVLSNLLTLLSLTIEHFIAFRWPLKHKFLVTKQRVLCVIGLSWLLAMIPMIIAWIEDVTDPSVPECFADKGFCDIIFYRHLKQNSHTNWIPSVVWAIITVIVLVVMIVVYGYIIWIINHVSVRNPGFRKKRSAVITTLCLVASFLISYIFFFIEHFYVLAEQDPRTQLVLDVNDFFTHICPACPLMLDFLFTGMSGAIMDPIIYCARMKEIKFALDRMCKGSKFMRRPSVTSATGYIRAPQHSINSVVEEENL